MPQGKNLLLPLPPPMHWEQFWSKIKQEILMFGSKLFGKNQLLKKMHLRNFGKNMIENVVFDSGTVRRIQALNAVVYYELFFSHTGSKKAALLVYTF